MTTQPPGTGFPALHELAELGRRLEKARKPDPYPRPTGPPPTLEQLREHSAELEAVARRHEIRELKVFGSVARGNAAPDSDLDVLIGADGNVGLLQIAAFQAELEDLLGCPVHVMTDSGLRSARQSTREQIAHEAIKL